MRRPKSRNSLMVPFTKIQKAAEKRLGKEALAARLPKVKSPAAIEKLMGDARLIRHLGKLRSVPANAAAIGDVSAEHGSFGAWIADWRDSDIVGLWDALAKRFSQLGGNSGPYFLRMAGKDTFIF